MTRVRFAPCRLLPLATVLAGAVVSVVHAGPMHDSPTSAATSGPVVIANPPIMVEAPRDRFGGVRASVSDFAHVDGAQMPRRSLSDEERQEMRRQIDEAIRKAYPRRRAQD
ncbi:hypothetical protein [Nitrogeniibacter aestuarii]|uniref:hypothetical protein n=1 Tax=Nitrogeniibacter aestuarii TaxID=2815343 RepID=UPI001D11E38F|nr:hypothetical protein [Nitrogeniibacter aestuarii]